VRVCTQTLCKSRSLAASESGSRQKQEQTTVTGIYDSVGIAAPILTKHITQFAHSEKEEEEEENVTSRQWLRFCKRCLYEA
jgi:hypothetical protein